MYILVLKVDYQIFGNLPFWSVCLSTGKTVVIILNDICIVLFIPAAQGTEHSSVACCILIPMQMHAHPEWLQYSVCKLPQQNDSPFLQSAASQLGQDKKIRFAY